MESETKFQLRLRKFQLKMISENSSQDSHQFYGDSLNIAVIGPKLSGKTTLVKDILSDLVGSVTVALLCSPGDLYSDVAEKAWISQSYDPEVVERFVDMARSNPPKRHLLVLDDCFQSRESLDLDEKVRWLFLNGRHVKTTTILALQDASVLSTVMRGNLDFAFLLREPDIDQRRFLYAHYAGMFPSFDAFCQVFDQCTTDHECLVIDMGAAAKSNKLEDQLLWYRADLKEGSATE
jgi:hypothetical protein